MGKSAVVVAPVALNPFEQLLRNVLRAIEEKRAELDRAAHDFLSKSFGDDAKSSGKKKNSKENSKEKPKAKPKAKPKEKPKGDANKRAAKPRASKPAASSSRLDQGNPRRKNGWGRGTANVEAVAPKVGWSETANTSTKVAAGAFALTALHVVVSKFRKRRERSGAHDTEGGDVSKDEAAKTVSKVVTSRRADSKDLDSAYSTPSKEALAAAKLEGEKAVREGGSRPGKPRSSETWDDFVSAAKQQAADVRLRSESMKRVTSIGTSGADKLASVVLAKTTMSRAQRRLRASGTLVVRVISVRFEAGTELSGNCINHGYVVRLQCEDGSQLATGDSSVKKYDPVAKAVQFHQRMSFALPETDKEGELRVQLFDAYRQRLCKAGLWVNAILRAAPVTKEFPLFGPDLSPVAHIQLSFDWIYDVSSSASTPRAFTADVSVE